MQPAIPCIYAQVSPVSGKIRTIGQTTRPLQTRAVEHLSHSLNGRYVCQAEIDWVRALNEKGLRPIVIMLEDCTGKDLDEREIWWIQFGLSIGWSLLNENAGGPGKKKLPKL